MTIDEILNCNVNRDVRQFLNRIKKIPIYQFYTRKVFLNESKKKKHYNKKNKTTEYNEYNKFNRNTSINKCNMSINLFNPTFF